MSEKKKRERKYLAHYIDSSFGAASKKYERLGKDLEEYNIEMNPDSETIKNIIGENSTNVKGFDVSSSVDTYYAREGDALFDKLYEIVNKRATGSDLETTVVDVLLKNDGTVDSAYREDAVIIPQSLGGDNSGIQIPFEVHYNGNRTEGMFDIETKTFTEIGSSVGGIDD